MKKTLKYILSVALVFSSFFLVESVSAINDSKLCIYDYKNNDDNVHIVVRDDGSAYIADVRKSEKGNLLNWDSADIGGFSGKSYFLGNNYACPPYMVVNVNAGKNEIYASDKDTLSKIDNAIHNEVHCPLIGEGLLSGAPQTIKSATKYTFTLPKTCTCETNSQLEPNAKSSFAITFNVDKILSKPKVKIEYEHSNNSESLHNWFPDDGGNEGNYVYVTDLIKTNSCPQYVVFSQGTNYWVALSDEANKSSVLSETKNGFAAKCHEVAEPEPKKSNSNSNKPSNTTSNSNSNTTSNSNHNADFMIVDQYKQCGGSSGALITNIPSIVPRITSTLYNTVMVLVPTILIIMGTVDLVKGIMSQKEDEMKKGREAFIKRLIGSVIIFLIVLIVKFFVGVVSRDGGNRARIVHCIDCFISNSCDIMS